MFEDLLSKLNSSGMSSVYAGVALDENGHLEVIQIDRSSKTIQKYTNRFVAYNAINREIESYDDFKYALQEAFEELQLPKNANITLAMPNVLFGIKELSSIIEMKDVPDALLNEVDSSYIFRNGEEPVISCFEVGETDGFKQYAYSAIKLNSLNTIKKIFSELGVNLISVQNSCSSLIEGLSFSGLTNGFVKNKETWNVLVISATSFNVFSFYGNKLLNFYEEPLAVKSYTGDEVYQEVAQTASTVLNNYYADNTLIISQTDEISAEAISSRMSISGMPIYLEQNKYQQQLPTALNVDFNVLPSYVAQITQTAIGAGIDVGYDEFFKFNFIEAQNGGAKSAQSDIVLIGGNPIEITPEKVNVITGIIVAVCLVIFGGLTLISNMAISKLNEEISALQEEETQLNQVLAQNKKVEPVKVETNIEDTINTIVNSNRKKMLYFDSLSYGIPNKLWIEYFYAGSGDAIGIKGATLNSSDITLFLKGIREVSGETDVSVNKLEVNNDDLTDTSTLVPDVYIFELSNSAFKSSGITNNENSNTEDGSYDESIPPADRPSSSAPVIPAD